MKGIIMTQEEEKNLLLKDLCARLPYGIMVWHPDYQEPQELDTIFNYNVYLGGGIQFQCDDINEIPHQLTKCKPYLRSLNSMTEEEKEEYSRLQYKVVYTCEKTVTDAAKDLIEWLDRNMFDHRWLIDYDLALEAREGMYGKEAEK